MYRLTQLATVLFFTVALACASAWATGNTGLVLVHPTQGFGNAWESLEHHEEIRVQLGLFTVINNAIDLQATLDGQGIDTHLFVAPTIEGTEQTVVVVSAAGFDSMDDARERVAEWQEAGIDSFPRTVTVYGDGGMTLESARGFFGL